MYRNLAGLLFLFTLFAGAAFAQVGVTSHLDAIKEEYPDGRLEKNETGIFVYAIESKELNADIAFGLDADWICATSLVRPHDSKSLKDWLNVLNEDWKKIKKKTWMLERKDGSTMICEQIPDKEIGDILFFYMKGTFSR